MTSHTIDVIDFAMPSLGADMTEGRITEWLVQPGDTVRRGQIVLVVETDKSDIEVEVFEPGRVTELLVGEGQMVEVGTPIARIERAAGVITAAAQPVDEPKRPERPSAPAERDRTFAPAAERTASHLTSPVLRHLAEQMHVDAATLTGSGPGGRVQRDDIERVAGAAHPRPRITPRARRMLAELQLDPAVVGAAALVTGDDVARIAESVPEAAGSRPEPSRATKSDTMRRHIADLMARSWREIPHYHVSARLDLTALVTALGEHNASRPLTDRLVPAAALLWAAARAAAAVPACNGWWRDGRFEQADRVDLGVVLSLRGGGIIVPTIARADELAIAPTMTKLTDLVQRARQGRLRGSDVGEASITVTNLGDLGADSVIGVIHPPQVVIVGFGAIHDDVWAVDGQVVCRPTVTATLAGDHRAIDGLTGSRFLAQLQAALDRPLLED